MNILLHTLLIGYDILLIDLLIETKRRDRVKSFPALQLHSQDNGITALTAGCSDQ